MPLANAKGEAMGFALCCLTNRVVARQCTYLSASPLCLLQHVTAPVRPHLTVLHIDDTQGVPMSFLCAEWFATAYTRNTPLPLALCALDLFLVRMDDVMIRLGLAILEVRLQMSGVADATFSLF